MSDQLTWQTVADGLQRIEVPGGWLYQMMGQRVDHDGIYYSTPQALTFVPRPTLKQRTQALRDQLTSGLQEGGRAPGGVYMSDLSPSEVVPAKPPKDFQKGGVVPERKEISQPSKESSPGCGKQTLGGNYESYTCGVSNTEGKIVLCLSCMEQQMRDGLRGI